MKAERVQTRPELKAVSLQSGIVYGPIRSRRFGLSLGINLLPSTYKLCSFNCLYCQYGWTHERTLTPTHQIKDLPRTAEITAALKSSLEALARRGTRVDSITFSGNGEPTLHPDLGEVIARARILRAEYLPQAKLVILSNSSTADKKEVREALALVDLRVMKLDAGNDELIRQLNGPAQPYRVREIVAGLKRLREVVLQSLFVQGRVTNAGPDAVADWVERVREIRPVQVQIYTLDRIPAEQRLWKVNLPTLQWIARQVYWRAGVKAEIY